MNKPPYLAILGRQPELGIVELESVAGPGAVEPLGPAALVGDLFEINRLGGVVKFGCVLYDGPPADLQELPVAVDELPMSGSKTPFAVSLYGGGATRGRAQATGLVLKKRLRARGPVRLVMPTEGAAVTAAGLVHNRVLESGFELLVVLHGNRLVIARTTGVQDVDWYSRRDYGRPQRPAKVGMLPPKLAQVLVNTTHSGAVVDPFCGSGVVLAEALLAQREALGSDMAVDMVAAARANLTWLATEVAARVPGTVLPAWSVEQSDAREVKLPSGSAVVSEGYLGAPMVRSPSGPELEPLQAELRELYGAALTNWAKQLPSGVEVSLCVPAWRVAGRWQLLDLVDELARLGYTQKVFKHVPTPLLYAREDQIVGRQLLFLRKG